ncbi:hypothetical protein [Brevibacillus sp. NRS-1366]|uniref:hypothetical protein n=1 Tax=Brevibacillus sp. NRS-1366 TaxID=3233899 RepID=UPI003D21A676
MDRFQYIENEGKPVAKCICKELLHEGEKVFQLDEYIVCDYNDCFRKLCIEKFGAVYGKINKEGNVE